MPVRDMLDLFPRLRVAIVGDAILDAFLVGVPTKLCRERPVPVVVKRAEHCFPGGAANVAANAHVLGAQVRFVTPLARDAAGTRLRDLLAVLGVPLDGVVDAPDARTSSKQRVIAGDHYLARVDEEPAGFDRLDVQQRMCARLRVAYEDADVLVLSDYGAGALGPAVLREVRGLRDARPIPLLVDAHSPGRYARLEPDVMTPNLDEAARAAGVPTPATDDERALVRLGRALVGKLHARAIAVTLGGDGALVADSEGAVRIAGRRVAVENTCGAGDSFAAALALALGTGANVTSAAALALEASAVAVAKPFTATVSLPELRERLDLLGSEPPEPIANEISAAAERLHARRARGERIVLTNGVFDLLHAGHIGLLQQARSMGDALVVALNSDRSARLVKGPNRPINDQTQRRAVLEALDCVDEVVTFDEVTAESAIEALRPDVYVRGDDWPLDELPEARAAERLGAEVVILHRTTDVTTSRIIERVAARTPYWSPKAN